MVPREKKQQRTFSVFTWRHGRHVGAPTESSRNFTLLLCERFLLFSLKNMAVDHVSENQQLRLLGKFWFLRHW